MFEHLEYTGSKSGEEIVNQLYDFMDKGGRHIALRPGMTPTLARLVIQKGTSIKKPFGGSAFHAPLPLRTRAERPPPRILPAQPRHHRHGKHLRRSGTSWERSRRCSATSGSGNGLRDRFEPQALNAYLRGNQARIRPGVPALDKRRKLQPGRLRRGTLAKADFLRPDEKLDDFMNSGKLSPKWAKVSSDGESRAR